MSRTLARVLLGPEPGQSVNGRAEIEPAPLASATVLIAGVSFVAGVIHVGASIDHAQEFLLYALAFGLLAAFQVAWAVCVMRCRSRRVLFFGGAVSLVVIGVWVASRTVGTPVASHPWVPESVGAADLMATVAESAIVIGTACMLMSLRSPIAQRVLARLSPLFLAVIFLCVMYGLGAGHTG